MSMDFHYLRRTGDLMVLLHLELSEIIYDCMTLGFVYSRAVRA